MEQLPILNDDDHRVLMEKEESIIRLNGDQIIERVTDQRNELIRNLLSSDNLRSYLSKHHPMVSISQVRTEFIQKSLNGLMGAK